MRSTRFHLWIAGLLVFAALGAAARATAPPANAADLLPDAHEARVLVLGELHGTNEAPALAAAVVRQRLDAGLPVTLALEVHAAEQPRLDAFLASNGDDAARTALLRGDFWQVPAERSDGRRSVAMLALLESMQRFRAAGHDVRVLAFDAGNAGGGAPRRNQRMAAVLREAIARDPQRAFVVLAGNYHLRRVTPDRMGGLLSGESPPVPTMAHLADLPVFRVNVTARDGEFWACMGGACGPQPVGPRGIWGGDEAGAPRYRQTPEDAGRYDAQLMLPRFSVAAPVAVEP
jgi:erythromycin esterase-like protein